MSKKRRRRVLGEHFNPRGRPKLSFDSREAALAYVAEHNHGEYLSPYRCTFCPKWHLHTNHPSPGAQLT